MWPREFTTVTQCLPAVTSVYHKTAILFIFLLLLLLLNIPLLTFKSAMQLIGIYFRYLFDHVCWPFWFDKQRHVTWIVNVWRQNQLSRVPLNLQSTCLTEQNKWQKYHWLFSKNSLINKLLIIVSTREKKGLQRRIVCRRKFLISPLQENIVRPLKQTPIANRVIL